jgi:hypothetical protein
VLPQLIPAGVLVTAPLPVPVLATDRMNVVWEGWEVKVAVQVLATSIVTTPVLQPVPVQPAKVEPVAGVAVKVTSTPLVNEAEQVLPQLIPAGLLVTVPVPLPVFVIDKRKLWAATWGLNVAVQVLAISIVTTPVLQPVPVQPAKVEPEAGAAVSVTSVPLANEAEQTLPQLIPAGLLVTVPLPVPLLVTDKRKVCAGCGLKVAAHERAMSMVTTPLLQPVPVQPAKVEPVAGVAVSVTSVPLLNEAEQVVPQLMPAGLLVTVPFPVPLLVVVFTTLTVSVNCCVGGGGVVVDPGVVPQISGE